jgi:hypothetical protein
MPVATRPKSNRDVLSRSVLNYVRRSQVPLRPTHLIRDLTENYSYSDVQSAVSALLENRQIQLTPERYVVIHKR